MLPACESGVEDDQMAQVSIFKIIRRYSSHLQHDSPKLETYSLFSCKYVIYSIASTTSTSEIVFKFFSSPSKEKEKLFMRCEEWWYSEYFQGQNERKIYRIFYYVWAFRERRMWGCMASSEVHIARQHEGSCTHSLVG